MSIDLAAGVVRVLDAQGQTAGAGFVLTAQGLIATCAHVVNGAGAGPGHEIELTFYAAGGVQVASVESRHWREPEAEDIAILRLATALPNGAIPLPLRATRGVAGHPCMTFGFPEAKPREGMYGYGTIGNAIRDENGQPLLQLTGAAEISPGFSGAPLLDISLSRVVGMITSITRPDEYGRLATTAFVTPAELLQAVCPELQINAPSEGETTPRYATAAIHELLTKAFSPSELRRLCRDYFPPVLVELGDDPSLNKIADTLVEYCERQSMFERLLRLVEQRVPARWAEYRDRVRS